MPVQASYIKLYTLQDTSKNNLLSDNNILSANLNSTNGNYLPPIIEKKYENFYEFILTNGEKKIKILDTILNESIINEIVDENGTPNKSLLYKVLISQNCISINENTFKDCSNLSLIDYSNYNNNENIYYNNSLTTIGNNAFENCKNLKECRLFDVSNIINNIGDNAFKDCAKLYEIQLEKSLIETIGDNAFNNCSILVTIKFPQTIKNIGSNAFTGTQLHNIYFLNSFPNGSLGSNIFSSITSKTICYYDLSYINGSNYSSLKSLFLNNDPSMIFVDTLNNNLENADTIFVITSNNIIENANTNFINIINNDISQTIINDAINILKSIIIKSPQNYSITISYDQTLNGTSTLGYANWTTQQIALNPSNNSGSNVYLNNISMSLNSVVLIHEILHILGYGSGTQWNNFSMYSTALDYYFTGINAIYQYNKILFANNYKKKLDYVTREDSGGSGTMGSHLEEGFYINESYFNPQMRADSQGNVYPSLSDEIMSGYLGNNNYFTILSCGVLQDLGYSINYNSPYIFNGSIMFYPDISLNTQQIPETFIINNLQNEIHNDLSSNNLDNIHKNLILNKMNKYKIKCNCKKNDEGEQSLCTYID